MNIYFLSVIFNVVLLGCVICDEFQTTEMNNGSEATTAEEHLIDGPTDSYFNMILNKYRQDLNPPAANMMFMEDDYNLHYLAIDMAHNCTLNASVDGELSDAYLVIQIVVPFGDDVVDALLSSLTEQGKLYDRASNNCSGDGGCESIKEYLKFIWHGLDALSCTTKECNTTDVNGTLLVCYSYFEPNITDSSGNIIPPYEIGPPCSHCPGDYPACDSYYSLCSPQVPVEMHLYWEEGSNYTVAGEPFHAYAEIIVYNQFMELYTAKMNPACYWKVEVVFIIASHYEAKLLGHTKVELHAGHAIFEYLKISKYGEFQLEFIFCGPEGIENPALRVQSDMIHIAPPPPLPIGECSHEEGHPQFARDYIWDKENCSEVCIASCGGPVSECVHLDGCGPNAICEDNKCVCKNLKDLSFQNFDSTFLREALRPETICDPNLVAVRIDKCGANAIGFALPNFYISGNKDGKGCWVDPTEDIDKQIFPYVQSCMYNDCRGRVTASENGLEYEFGVSGNFGDCNAVITENDTHVTYSHTICGYGGFSNHLITRKRPIEICFSCTYARTVQYSTGSGITPFLGQAKLSISGYGEFGVEIGIWKDSTYTERYIAPPTLLVPDKIYAAVKVRGLHGTPITLYAYTCWATLTPDPNDEIRDDIIVDGCAVGSDVTVAQNGEGDEVIFCFDSFTFADAPDNTTIYVHCNVTICVEDQALCTSSCLQRRKRDVAATNAPNASVFIGPLNIHRAGGKRKRSASSLRHSSYFSPYYSTQEVANPPFARTSGIGEVTTVFS